MIVHELGDHVPQSWWIGRFYKCDCKASFTLEEKDCLLSQRAIHKPEILTVVLRCPGCKYMLELAADRDDEKGLVRI